MSLTRTGNPAASGVRLPAPARETAGAGDPRSWLRRPAVLAVTLAGAALLAAACGGGSPGPASPPSRLYQQSLTYSICMRSHGVPDFPILKQGPGGTLVHPVSPPAGMLTAPGYDAAFRACLKLTVVGGGSPARYRAIALKALQQAECMRAHGITNYPSPGTLEGGIHVPDATVIGLDTHTLLFQAAGQACGMRLQWQTLWWWPAPLGQPSTMPQYFPMPQPATRRQS
jgi:hypothetical protein